MCEKCLYRNNCHFLSTHKNSVKNGGVTECTVFEIDDRYKLSEEAQIQLKETADALEFQLLVALNTEEKSISISTDHGLTLMKLCMELIRKETRHD